MNRGSETQLQVGENLQFPPWSIRGHISATSLYILVSNARSACVREPEVSRWRERSSIHFREPPVIMIMSLSHDAPPLITLTVAGVSTVNLTLIMLSVTQESVTYDDMASRGQNHQSDIIIYYWLYITDIIQQNRFCFTIIFASNTRRWVDVGLMLA